MIDSTDCDDGIGEEGGEGGSGEEVESVFRRRGTRSYYTG